MRVPQTRMGPMYIGLRRTERRKASKMNRETGKVFMACAIGAGIGSLVALEVAQAFWWLGLIVGGLAGYLSYEWRAVMRAIPVAYRAARGWHAPERYWQQVWWFFVIFVNVSSWLTAFFLASNFGAERPVSISELIYGIAVSYMGVFPPVVSLAIANRNITPSTTTITAMRQASYWLFPPIVVFWHLPRGIWWLMKCLPRVAVVIAVGIAHGAVAFVRFLRRFSGELFLRIHSELRLLCGVDAMLGAAVGYFTGSALVGALVGGLFGVLNYAVVTERWLKPRGYLPIR